MMNWVKPIQMKSISMSRVNPTGLDLNLLLDRVGRTGLLNFHSLSHFQIYHLICKTHIGSTNPLVDLKLGCMEIGKRWLGDGFLSCPKQDYVDCIGLIENELE